jgi:hypothetical protein
VFLQVHVAENKTHLSVPGSELLCLFEVDVRESPVTEPLVSQAKLSNSAGVVRIEAKALLVRLDRGCIVALAKELIALVQLVPHIPAAADDNGKKKSGYESNAATR